MQWPAYACVCSRMYAMLALEAPSVRSPSDGERPSRGGSVGVAPGGAQFLQTHRNDEGDEDENGFGRFAAKDHVLLRHAACRCAEGNAGIRR
jgi:hypothetical protein